MSLDGKISVGKKIGELEQMSSKELKSLAKGYGYDSKSVSKRNLMKFILEQLYFVVEIKEDGSFDTEILRDIHRSIKDKLSKNDKLNPYLNPLVKTSQQVAEYVSTARKYIHIILNHNQKVSFCDECNSSRFTTRDGCKSCYECGLIIGYFNSRKISRMVGGCAYEIGYDPDYSSPTNYYSPTINLFKTISKFQEMGMVSHASMSRIRDEIEKRKIDPVLLKCAQVKKILKDLKLQKLNEHVYGITRQISGRTIKLDIPKILNFHREMRFVCGEKNSLNVHYKLFKLMKLCGTECQVSDFLIPESRFEYYEETWNKIKSTIENGTDC